MKRFIAAFLILTSSASGRILDDSKLYERALDSVVWICALDSGWDESHGTGVMVSPDMILTSYHVVHEKAIIWAHSPERFLGLLKKTPAEYRASDETSMRCVVLKADPEKGLALLMVKKGESRGKPIQLAKKDPAPGQAIFAIGNGEDALFGYAGGNVRQVLIESRTIDGHDLHAEVVEMTLSPYPGDSGGPILNRKGKLVGIYSHIDNILNQVSKGINITEIRAFLEGCVR
jgi:S1-C subfamily serine protease